ncbi:MAG TPA: hypothetical protein VME22_22405 [Solirubrobacteraceae bacterium]|nr:hypothetical protein [Solirubrobacteraceae bacterium]
MRVIVGVLAVVGLAMVLASMLNTVVVPRAVPTRLARVAFLAVHWLLRLRLRLTGRSDYATRDRIFAVQAPLGVFAQLTTWGVLIWLLFAALFWSLVASAITGRAVSRALELSGSSMLTLGFDAPAGLTRQLTAFAAAAVGLSLLALVIAYLPTLYSAFSRREELITKLTVRTGSPPTGPALLSSTWELGRFDELEEVWDPWEDWFIEVGESHTSFPQLPFFRSPRPNNHWVLASETVLDGAALLITACDGPRNSRSELCLNAGIHALISIADFLGIPHRPPEPGAEISLPEESFNQAFSHLQSIGVPMSDDRKSAWAAFRAVRARYEPLLAVIGRMTDAPRSDWSSWSEDTPRHSPPLLRSRARATTRSDSAEQ